MTIHDLKEKLIGEFREKYHYQEGVELLLKSPNHFQVYDATAGIESFISHAIDVACAEMGKELKSDSEIIDEFLRGTPDWLKSLDAWDDGSGCKMCGARYEKIKKLHSAIQAQSQKIEEFMKE